LLLSIPITSHYLIKCFVNENLFSLTFEPLMNLIGIIPFELRQNINYTEQLYVNLYNVLKHLISTNIVDLKIFL